MAKDLRAKLLAIGRELGLSPEELQDFETFINAVYDAIINKRARDEEEDDIETLLNLVQRSKTLQEPFTAYMVLRMLEDSKYRKGFMDGIKMAKASHKSEVEKKASDIVTRILNIWEKQLIPQMTRIFSAMNSMLSGRPQPFTPSIPIQFEESSESEENKPEEGIKIEFGGEEEEEEEQAEA